MLVISNTTPFISLAVIGQLHLLPLLYGHVIIAPAVQAELQRGGSFQVGVIEFGAADWINVIALQDPRRADLLNDLDRGEAETIALAQELNADLVLMDERLGRKYARRAGLKISGTLGVLVKAKMRGIVPAVKPLIEQLLQNGIYLNGTVIQEALALAGEN